jgi:hypothetical protein
MNYTTMGLQAICQPNNEPTTGPIIVFGQATDGSNTGFSVSPIWSALSIASSAASAYHGYKRNNSVGWALWWGFMGGLFPVITPAIALAQGFSKPE